MLLQEEQYVVNWLPCLFATVDFQGGEEPEILFYTEEKVHEGIPGSA